MKPIGNLLHSNVVGVLMTVRACSLFSISVMQAFGKKIYLFLRPVYQQIGQRTRLRQDAKHALRVRLCACVFFFLSLHKKLGETLIVYHKE